MAAFIARAPFPLFLFFSLLLHLALTALFATPWWQRTPPLRLVAPVFQVQVVAPPPTATPTASPTPAPTTKPPPKVAPQTRQKPLPDTAPKTQPQIRAKAPPAPAAAPPQTLPQTRQKARESEAPAAQGQDLPPAGEAVDEPLLREYVALITARVEAQWRRPANLPEGVEARLLLQLLPSGEILTVRVVESSNWPAFDESARRAVRRVGRIPEISRMPGELFESHFRRLYLRFAPEGGR